MSERVKGVTFHSYKALAKWLINTNAGRRFLDWFCRKYSDVLLSLPAGYELHERAVQSVIESGNDESNTHKTTTVVIECIPDSVSGDGVHLQVYAPKFISVVFADRLKLENVNSRLEQMAEELVKIELPFRAKDIYGESAFLRARHHAKVVGVLERQAKDYDAAIHKQLSKIIKKG